MTIISDQIGGVQLGDAQQFLNLTIFPLTREVTGDPIYLTLAEALEQDKVRVREISDSGSVPELKLDNPGTERILLLDGEELIGAKQNRILNLTLMAPAQKTIDIPVSCVEAGRWHHTSEHFEQSNEVMYMRLRSSKAEDVSLSMAANGSRRSNQGAVWGSLEQKMNRMAVESPTAEMHALYRSHRRSVNEYVKEFKAVDNQVGALFAIDGKVVGMEMLDHPKTFTSVLPKLIRSYALDAIETAERTLSKVPDRDAAIAFMNRVSASETESYPAIGEGTDLRFKGDHVAGGALEVDENLVHLCAFDRTDDAPGEERHLYAQTRLRRRWHS